MDNPFIGGLARNMAWFHSVIRIRASRVPPEPWLSPGVQWQLVSTLYGQTAPLYSSLFAMLLVGGVTWLRTGETVTLVWTAIATAVFAARLRDIAAFHHRRPEDSPQRWTRRFLIGAWVQAALWGAASLVLLITTDAFTQFVVIATQSGNVAGAAARNNAVPKVALGQVLLTLLPLLAVCLLHPDRAYLLFVLLVLANIAASTATVRNLHRQTVHLLLADEDNDSLVQSLAAANAKLETANQRLQNLAATDGLTGVANRRGLDQALLTSWSGADRHTMPFATLLVDIDHFKAYNDRFGHQAGDDCLRRIARCLEATACRRADDLVARYGGEEFAVILPGTDHAGAIVAAERLRAAVVDLNLPHPDSPTGQVTISVGVAATEALGEMAADPSDLLALADRALYGAKQAGRNRVTSAAHRLSNA